MNYQTIGHSIIPFHNDIPAKAKVLVIDDSTVNLRFLEVVLRKAGFEVVSTSNALEAVPLALDQDPHIILLDVLMPGVNGLEVLRLLKQNHVTQNVPVLMVSSQTTGEAVRQALEGGAFDFLKKPVEAVEVLARVESALRYKARQDQLVEMATHDSLTGLFNHRLLIELLERELAAGRRKTQPVSFCMADIDHFKRLNDRYGHQVGDFVLREISQILAQGLRKSDPLGRYGGEEFGIVLGGCDPDRAEALCERLRQSVEDHVFLAQGQPIRVTLSLGLAHVGPEEDITETELVRRADTALYRAKELGRNRLVS